MLVFTPWVHTVCWRSWSKAPTLRFWTSTLGPIRSPLGSEPWAVGGAPAKSRWFWRCSGGAGSSISIPLIRNMTVVFRCLFVCRISAVFFSFRTTQLKKETMVGAMQNDTSKPESFNSCRQEFAMMPTQVVDCIRQFACHVHVAHYGPLPMRCVPPHASTATASVHGP